MATERIKKYTVVFSFLFLILFSFAPLLHAQTDRSGGGSSTGITYECDQNDSSVGITNPNDRLPGECDFYDLIAAIKKVLNIATIFCLAFSVVVIAVAGWNYMRSGDSPGKRSEANKMLRSVAIGIFFVLAAWLIVTLILDALVDPSIRKNFPI